MRKTLLIAALLLPWSAHAAWVDDFPEVTSPADADALLIEDQAGPTTSIISIGTLKTVFTTDPQQAAEVPTITTNFDGNLSVADDDVQKALETLDDMVSGGGSAADTTVNATGFSGNLSPTDDDVQTALETVDALSFGVSDSNAIHVNAPSEISGITEKTVPVADDVIVIEDSADSNNKKSVKISSLPSTGAPYPGVGVPRSSGTSWDKLYPVATTVADPGSDDNLVTEQAVREGLDAIAAGSMTWPVPEGFVTYVAPDSWGTTVYAPVTTIRDSGTADNNSVPTEAAVRNAIGTAFSYPASGITTSSGSAWTTPLQKVDVVGPSPSTNELVSESGIAAALAPKYEEGDDAVFNTLQVGQVTTSSPQGSRFLGINNGTSQVDEALNVETGRMAYSSGRWWVSDSDGGAWDDYIPSLDDGLMHIWGTASSASVIRFHEAGVGTNYIDVTVDDSLSSNQVFNLGQVLAGSQGDMIWPSGEGIARYSGTQSWSASLDIDDVSLGTDTNTIPTSSVVSTAIGNVSEMAWPLTGIPQSAGSSWGASLQFDTSPLNDTADDQIPSSKAVADAIAAAGGISYPSGTGIPQVSGGAAWGATLNVDTSALTNSDSYIPTSQTVQAAIDALPSGDPMVWPGGTAGQLPTNGTGDTWGSNLDVVTTVGNPGFDDNIPTEASVRTAIAAVDQMQWPPGDDGTIPTNSTGDSWGGALAVDTNLADGSDNSSVPTGLAVINDISNEFGATVDQTFRNVTTTSISGNGSGLTNLDYNDITDNAPTIPTNNNQLTNGAGYDTVSSVNSKIAAEFGSGVDQEFGNVTVQTIASSGAIVGPMGVANTSGTQAIAAADMNKTIYHSGTGTLTLPDSGTNSLPVGTTSCILIPGAAVPLVTVAVAGSDQITLDGVTNGNSIQNSSGNDDFMCFQIRATNTWQTWGRNGTWVKL